MSITITIGTASNTISEDDVRHIRLKYFHVDEIMTMSDPTANCKSKPNTKHNKKRQKNDPVPPSVRYSIHRSRS